MRRWKHSCAAPRCESLISTRFLFCGPHWRRVPQSLQLAINSSFAEVVKAKKKYETPEAGERDHRLAGPLADRLREYDEARDAAIDILGRAA